LSIASESPNKRALIVHIIVDLVNAVNPFIVCHFGLTRLNDCQEFGDRGIAVKQHIGVNLGDVADFFWRETLVSGTETVNSSQLATDENLKCYDVGYLAVLLIAGFTFFE